MSKDEKRRKKEEEERKKEEERNLESWCLYAQDSDCVRDDFIRYTPEDVQYMHKEKLQALQLELDSPQPPCHNEWESLYCDAMLFFIKKRLKVI